MGKAMERSKSSILALQMLSPIAHSLKTIDAGSVITTSLYRNLGKMVRLDWLQLSRVDDAIYYEKMWI